MSFPLVRTLLKNYILIFHFYFTLVWRTFITCKVSITVAICKILKKGFFLVNVALVGEKTVLLHGNITFYLIFYCLLPMYAAFKKKKVVSANFVKECNKYERIFYGRKIRNDVFCWTLGATFFVNTRYVLLI